MASRDDLLRRAKEYRDENKSLRVKRTALGGRKSIEAFRAKQLHLDLARKAHFRFRIQPPWGLSLSGHQTEDTISMMCTETQFPDISASTAGETSIGTDNEYQIVTKLNYGSIDATFLCDTKHTQRIFFESWMKKMWPKNSLRIGGSPEYYDNYIGSIDVFQLKHNFMEDDYSNMKPTSAVTDDWTLGFRLHEVYPMNVNQLEVSWDSSNEVHKLTVSFHFKSYDLLVPPQT
jgi:hypothetical protein